MKLFKIIVNKNKGVLYIFSLILILSACDVLEKEPLNSLHQEELWSELGFIEMYLNDIYRDFLPVFPFSDDKKLTCEGLSDETQYISLKDNDDNSLDELAKKLIFGDLLKDDFRFLDQNFYTSIAKINRLVVDIQTSPIDDEDRQLIIAQALFLRAYGYWGQVNLHGGIPMVMEKFDHIANGEIVFDKIYPERNKTSECIDLIINDLDSAFKYLPSVWDGPDDYGRVTRGAALALKGRVLLFWSSPQFNPENKQERWQLAYEANKNALEVLEFDGYGLHPSFQELFHGCVEKTSEAIFVRVYDIDDFSHKYDAKVRPELAGASGGGLTNNPTWEMVQAFPMLDGFPINDNTGSYAYDTSLFWLNRDPRLDYTIAYNSGSWPLSGDGNYKIWTYYVLDGGSYSVPTSENHTSTTGFFCKKYINPAIKSDQLAYIGTDWMEIRFAEVLLNFAECANEIGQTSEAREALYRIRNERTDVKAGMDYIDKHLGDQAIMREIIMTERQVELAFEEKRYFDLRRRNMFTKDLGPNIKKINGLSRKEYRVLFDGASTSAEEMLLIRNDLDFSNIRQYNNSFNRRYTYEMDNTPIYYPQPKYNFLPAHEDHIKKNINFERNIFWGGEFDPFEE